jgi:hypothetical protein
MSGRGGGEEIDATTETSGKGERRLQHDGILPVGIALFFFLLPLHCHFFFSSLLFLTVIPDGGFSQIDDSRRMWTPLRARRAQMQLPRDRGPSVSKIKKHTIVLPLKKSKNVTSKQCDTRRHKE